MHRFLIKLQISPLKEFGNTSAFECLSSCGDWVHYQNPLHHFSQCLSDSGRTYHNEFEAYYDGTGTGMGSDVCMIDGSGQGSWEDVDDGDGGNISDIRTMLGGGIGYPSRLGDLQGGSPYRSEYKFPV